MEHAELIKLVAKVLENLQIKYFVTGGTASIYYGEPRFTNDIDVVVEMALSQVESFCRQFPISQYYIEPEAVKFAIATKHQFNIIHSTTGLKIDVIVAQTNALDASRFSRRREIEIDGQRVQFASAEDVIIKKMVYYREGGSEKHIRDITSILQVNLFPIDTNYIQTWADQLELQDIWQTIQKRTQ